jgi:hypothetical protein
MVILRSLHESEYCTSGKKDSLKYVLKVVANIIGEMTILETDQRRT